MLCDLTHSNLFSDSYLAFFNTNPIQSVEKMFQITKADKELLSKQEYDVQAWCMLLNDKVPFRMQWPQYADLQVNGVPVRAINRPGSQLLGANGRDYGPIPGGSLDWFAHKAEQNANIFSAVIVDHVIFI
ncbi:E3 SUMO-protein ligase SIZ1-like isoform X2 [Gossypium australe]|uniref:E3 SUMO-protein ligase SIZ1-like isoform X2 n=1 Tax=Gossypium australe TaxID=47621 RepID=A0A5B6VUT8_9ROSI|nr:E3 SUMO-protein ligase SIZ1-like isoform X2 [Gossypium australe]